MLIKILDSSEGMSMKRLTIIGLIVAAGVAGIAIGAVAAFAIRGPRLAAFPMVTNSRVEVIPPRGMFDADDIPHMDRFDLDPNGFGTFDRMPHMLSIWPVSVARRGFGLWAALSVIGAVTGISALVLTLVRRPRPAGSPPADPQPGDSPPDPVPAA